jgi:hypothetical protein
VKPLRTSEQLIDRTRAIWAPRLGRDLSHEDAREIIDNFSGFFAVLAEWSWTEAQELSSPIALECEEASDER